MSVGFNAIEQALQAAQRVFGGSISYVRGGTTVELTATKGKTEWQTQNPETGIVISAETRDWIIDPSEISVLGKPQPGDKIIETIGSVVLTFTVVAPDQNAGCFRYTDANRTRFRVYSRQVGEA